jgi:hypothetical protein
MLLFLSIHSVECANIVVGAAIVLGFLFVGWALVSFDPSHGVFWCVGEVVCTVLTFVFGGSTAVSLAFLRQGGAKRQLLNINNSIFK